MTGLEPVIFDYKVVNRLKIKDPPCTGNSVFQGRTYNEMGFVEILFFFGLRFPAQNIFVRSDHLSRWAISHDRCSVNAASNGEKT